MFARYNVHMHGEMYCGLQKVEVRRKFLQWLQASLFTWNHRGESIIALHDAVAFLDPIPRKANFGFQGSTGVDASK